jgi:hypothetical protein
MGNFVVETERNFRISDLLTEEQMPKELPVGKRHKYLLDKT